MAELRPSIGITHKDVHFNLTTKEIVMARRNPHGADYSKNRKSQKLKDADERKRRENRRRK